MSTQKQELLRADEVKELRAQVAQLSRQRLGELFMAIFIDFSFAFWWF